MNNRFNRPKKLVASLKFINENLANKFGKTEYVIYSKWEEIVGSFFAQYSEPYKITNLPRYYEGDENKYHEKILYVNVASAAALEFQHFQNKIIEKINSFFGYKAIHHIKLYQNFTSKNKHTCNKKTNKSDNYLINQKNKEINDTTQKINDKELKKSLLNLGLSIEKFKEN